MVMLHKQHDTLEHTTSECNDSLLSAMQIDDDFDLAEHVMQVHDSMPCIQPFAA